MIKIKKYIIIDKNTGKIKQIMQWANNRKFPKNYPLQENEEVITLKDDNKINSLNFKYNFETKEFEEFKPEPIKEIPQPSVQDLQKQVFDLTTQLVENEVI